MNPDQTKSLVRWMVSAFGAGFAGYIAGKGIASADNILGVLQSDTFIQGISAIVTLGALVWSLFSHREKNVAAAASSMPNVAGVITKDTPQGAALAKAVPDPAVTQAGSAKAKAIAK